MVLLVQHNLYTLETKRSIVTMIVIGLLSSQQEAEEIKYIAKVCTLEDRIHFLVRMQKIKTLLKEEDKHTRKC